MSKNYQIVIPVAGPNNNFEKFKECVGEVIEKRRSFFELPDDFDPCQPQNILPFKKREPEIIKEDIFNNKEKIQKKKKVG